MVSFAWHPGFGIPIALVSLLTTPKWFSELKRRFKANNFTGSLYVLLFLIIALVVWALIPDNRVKAPAVVTPVAQKTVQNEPKVAYNEPQLNNNAPTWTENKEMPPAPKAEEKTEPQTSTLQTQLETIVKRQWEYTITYIGNETDDNFYLDIQEAPWKNSIVISWPASSCDDAKRDVYEIYKWIYTNPALSMKLWRVKVISYNMLKASMWYTDGSKMDWSSFWPSLMMDVYGQIGTEEIEYWSLDDRTYGFFFWDCS